MPAISISASNLGWSTPDGHRIFHDLDLDFGRERVGLVGRNGVGKSTLLKLLTGELAPTTGAVRVQGVIGTLHQRVQVSEQETIADLLGLAPALALLRRAESGVATIDELAEADWTLEARAAAALAQLGLDVSLDTPLLRLSGGQRTRAALAGAVLAEPDFLLLDEPTNNLDRDGREAVAELLAGWRAGAIVVSHDRELLGAMDAIVELTTLGASRYGGGWTAYRERKDIELAAAEHDLAAAERRKTELARRMQQTVERQDRRDAAGGRRAARGDLPRILLGARRERAENSSGNNARLADRLRGESELAVELAKGKMEHQEALRVALAPTGLAPSRVVLTLDEVTFGYGDGEPVLRNVSLTLTGPERVALVGGNGAGKSTLFGLVMGDLTPWSGRVERRTALAFLDQRVGILDASTTIAANFARLNPGVNENGTRAALARFRFRADAADQCAGQLSGGQMLRAGLACVLGSPDPPPLLILDEPSNHLDVDSIEAVEAGLRAFDGAILVASHDAAFLERIGVTRRVKLNGGG